MPLDARPPLQLAEAWNLARKVRRLNRRLRHHSAADVLDAGLRLIIGVIGVS